MKQKKAIKLRLLLFIITGLIFCPVFSQTPVINLKIDQANNNVSPMLYGLMTEEINHSYDGGLYAELIRNRIFKDSKTEPEGWTLVKENPSSEAAIKLIAAEEHVPNDERRNALNGAMQACLRLTIEKATGKDVAGSIIEFIEHSTDAEKNEIADKLHQYTGVSKDYVLQSNLRLYVGRFNKELLRDSGLTVGRLDTRFTGYDYDEAGESFEYDPSYDKTVYGPFAAAVNDYIKRDLNFSSDLPYEILTGRVGDWPLSNDRYLNVAENLRQAMTKNPFLKVWIAQGYYDMATPYFATENVVSHMFLKKDIRQNLHFTFYEAGHMVYINKPSLSQLKNDFSNFIQQALPKQQ